MKKVSPLGPEGGGEGGERDSIQKSRALSVSTYLDTHTQFFGKGSVDVTLGWAIVDTEY